MIAISFGSHKADWGTLQGQAVAPPPFDPTIHNLNRKAADVLRTDTLFTIQYMPH